MLSNCRTFVFFTAKIETFLDTYASIVGTAPSGFNIERWSLKEGQCVSIVYIGTIRSGLSTIKLFGQLSLSFSTDSGSEETATKDLPSDSTGNGLLGRAEFCPS